MAVSTSSIVPFKVNNIPDRYTMVYVNDFTLTTASGSAASSTVRLNRLQSGSFTMATAVIDVVEMGSAYRPGGVDNLGECSWNLGWNSVGVGNLAALTGTAIPTTNNTTVTITSTTINASTQDFIRLVADNAGNVFGTLYFQDCIIETYGVDASESGVVMETATGKGPSSLYFPGYIIPKTYVVTSGDITAGYLSVGTGGGDIFSTSEAPVPVFQPSWGNPPSYWQQNGSYYFLKIERVPQSQLANIQTATPIRYKEQVGAMLQFVTTIGTIWVTPSVFNAGFTTIGRQVFFAGGTNETKPVLAIASQVNTTNTGSITAGAGVVVTPTGGNGMLGIKVGVSLLVDTVASTKQETVQVTAVSPTTFTATFAQNHAAGVPIVSTAPSFQVALANVHAAGSIVYPALNATQNYAGQATYNVSNGRLTLGDLVAGQSPLGTNVQTGDLMRLVFCTYNTDTSLPKSIPNNADTADRAAVPTRLTPLKINALNANRIQKASYKMTLRRAHVQGIGENAILYGVSSVPDIAIDLDAKETDLSLLAQLQTGSTNLTSGGATSQSDFEDLNYITRITLVTPVPTSINLYDPFQAGSILATWSSPQYIPTSFAYSSTNKADNSIRISGQDITGNLSISYTTPQ